MIAIRESDLLILVGLTGVGKTTSVEALRASGVDVHLLPGRRTLTDEHIIGWLQERDGVPRRPVTDRAERFRAARRFRELRPGGMAEVLARLEVGAEASWLLFDGLRGVQEVTWAARELPRARFLHLTAPCGVRLLRLLGRGEAFDRIAAPASDAAPELAIVEPEWRDRIEDLLRRGDVDRSDLAAKLAILEKEQQNYSQDETRAALEAEADGRWLEVRTDLESPEEVAGRLRELLLGASA